STFVKKGRKIESASDKVSGNIKKTTKETQSFAKTLSQNLLRPLDGFLDELGELTGNSNLAGQATSALTNILGSLSAGTLAAVAAVGALAAAFVIVGIPALQKFGQLQKSLNETFTLLPDITRHAMGVMTQQLQTFNKQFGLLSEQSVPALYQAIS